MDAQHSATVGRIACTRVERKHPLLRKRRYITPTYLDTYIPTMPCKQLPTILRAKGMYDSVYQTHAKNCRQTNRIHSATFFHTLQQRTTTH